jgi:hypothetical protein
VAGVADEAEPFLGSGRFGAKSSSLLLKSRTIYLSFYVAFNPSFPVVYHYHIKMVFV